MTADYDDGGWKAWSAWSETNFTAETEGNAQRAFFAGRRSQDAELAEQHRQIEGYKATLKAFGLEEEAEQ